MNFTKLKVATITFNLFLSTMASAAGDVQLNWRFQDAASGETIKASSSIEIPQANALDRFVTTDQKIKRTILITKMANSMKLHLEKFKTACKVERPNPLPMPVPMPIPAPMPHPMPKPGIFSATSLVRSAAIIERPTITAPDCQPSYTKVAVDFLATVESANEDLFAIEGDNSDLIELVDLSRSLAKNMKEQKFPIGFWGIREMATMNMKMTGGLNLTAGGAQDISYFKKQVKDGQVPSAESLTIEGLLSEFDLALENTECSALICLNPALAIDQDKRKLYVQVAMNSNQTKASFQRNALNLSIVLDVSGSMSATDNTEKSRIEWAKTALRHVVDQLNAEDTLSIVLFNQEANILLPTMKVDNKELILAKVEELQAKGSTNLEAGLRSAYELVSENFVEGKENRVILVSDAGLNTGETTESALVKLVSDYAAEGIGLTAIGLGLNFNQKFIHGITMSKGGNYTYVHSGAKMYGFFKNFNYLVTPVAHNLKVKLELPGIDAKLVKAYGVPSKEGEPLKELINIRSLFFSEAGGAILLEYDLN